MKPGIHQFHRPPSRRTIMSRGRGMAGDGDITVDVELLARNLMQMQEGTAPEEKQRATASIHRLSRVPIHLRDNNPKDYTPGFVAIGPLHDRADRRLHPAERLKVTYLNSLISRGHRDSSCHLAVIEGYVRVIAAGEKEARAMYVDEEVAGIGADNFIQMMVLDGCFIIEHLINVALGHEDPLMPSRQLSVDLILVENQMPFFILVDLIARTKLPYELKATGYTPSVLLVKLVLFYLAGEKGRDTSEALPPAGRVSHILHLLHEMLTTARTMWEPPSRVPDRSRAQGAMRLLRGLPSLLAVPLLRRILPEGGRRRARLEDDVPSASDMKRMHVHFKKTRAAPGNKPVVGISSVMGPIPLAVTLHENQLQLPQLWLEFRTLPLLLNLMAFEQSAWGSRTTKSDVSAYVCFMANMVRSAEDARLLAEAEVVQQQIGGLGNESIEEMARFFRVVGTASEATGRLKVSYLGRTLDLLESRSDRWVDLDRNYFTFLAEFLALVTFVSGVSTIVQTYAAFKYH